MPSVLATDEILEAGASLDALLARRGDRSSWDEHFAADYSGLSQTLHQDGWLALAAPEASGGSGVRLRDLLELSMVWGGHLIPAPFSIELALRAHDLTANCGDLEPVTAALPWTTGLVVPFAGFPSVRIVDAPGPSVATGAVDDFSPALPLSFSAGSTTVSSAVLASVALLGAAECVGAASRALQMAKEYAGQRSAYGKPIATYQAVKHRFANMHRDVEMAKSALCWGAETAPENERAVRFAIARSRSVVESAIQVYGGIGYTWELGVHFYLRHVLSWGLLTDVMTRSHRSEVAA